MFAAFAPGSFQEFWSFTITWPWRKQNNGNLKKSKRLSAIFVERFSNVTNSYSRITSQQSSKLNFSKTTRFPRLNSFYFSLNQRITCEICDKSFSLRSTKDQHIKDVHGEKNFFCHTCGKRFGTKPQLKKHIKHSHDTTVAPCDICNKVFTLRNLKNHKEIHSDYRPHKCPFCTECFKTKGTLKRHLYSHSKTRPYNCLQCETGYYMLSYLKAHYQRKHGVSYSMEDTEKNCRKEKPQLPINVRI